MNVTEIQTPQILFVDDEPDLQILLRQKFRKRIKTNFAIVLFFIIITTKKPTGQAPCVSKNNCVQLVRSRKGLLCLRFPARANGVARGAGTHYHRVQVWTRSPVPPGERSLRGSGIMGGPASRPHLAI